MAAADADPLYGHYGYSSLGYGHGLGYGRYGYGKRAADAEALYGHYGLNTLCERYGCSTFGYGPGNVGFGGYGGVSFYG